MNPDPDIIVTLDQRYDHNDEAYPERLRQTIY